METQISRNLQRCSEIADQLLDISDSDHEVTSLAQELERLIEDLFVMTRTEDAREEYINQKLKDADVDPDGLVGRTLEKMTDSSDQIVETIKNLTEVYSHAMIEGEKLWRIKNS